MGTSEILPAATLLLVRDTSSGLEVFMVKRHHAIDFVPGAMVFPGGKVEPGETPEATLVRELREELGIDTRSACLAPLTFASHAYEGFHLLMPLYVCRTWEGIVQPLEGQGLKWLRPRDLRGLDMPPADSPLIAPLIDLL